MGGKWWRWDYRRPITNKRNTLSLGTYPDVSLAAARERHAEARKLLAAGIDPGEQRKAVKAAGLESAANSFEVIAREYLTMQTKKLTAGTIKREYRLLDKDLAPYIGKLPVTDVSAPALLGALRKIEGRGAIETAHRVRALAGRIFRYAIATGRAERDPASDLIGALAHPEVAHYPSITDPAEVGALLRALWSYPGTAPVAAALKLAPMVFVRPGELRRARWADFDLDKSEWRFSASKTGQPHIVPLAAQAVDILQDLQTHTGRGEFVFPGARGRGRPMSEAAVNAALQRMGFGGDVITGHGFRAMARTILDEVLGVRPDYIEHQLAHAVRDPLGRAYNRTQHLDERRKMMQAWADYLDGLRIGGEAIPFRAKVA